MVVDYFVEMSGSKRASVIFQLLGINGADDRRPAEKADQAMTVSGIAGRHL
jgi:hypothetical protein